MALRTNIKMMRYFTPGVILALAVSILFFCFFGDGSYAKLLTLRQSLQVQRLDNAATAQHVQSLRRKIYGLQQDNRVLEKTARNELGMARADELIFFFERGNKDGER